MEEASLERPLSSPLSHTCHETLEDRSIVKDTRRRAAVVGSRGFLDYELLCRTLDGMAVSCVVTGDARGADTLARRYAHDRQLPLTVFRPEWKKYGRAAGIMRNADIVASADVVVAFWDGKSPGTLNTIERAEKANLETRIVNFNSGMQGVARRTKSSRVRTSGA